MLQAKAKNYQIVDAGPAPAIRGAVYVGSGKKSMERLRGLDKEEKLLLVCAKGKRAYFLQNRLRHYGYKNTKVLEGSLFFNDVKVQNAQLP